MHTSITLQIDGVIGSGINFWQKIRCFLCILYIRTFVADMFH